MVDHPAANSRPAPAKKRTGLWIGIAAAVVLVGAAIAVPVTIANAEAAQRQADKEQSEAEIYAELDRLAAFDDALSACGMERGDYVKVLDLGESIDFTYVGYTRGGDVPAVTDLYCFLGELDAPSSLESKIGATTALDGAQTDQWGDFEITWRYHPDSGATVTVEHAS